MHSRGHDDNNSSNYTTLNLRDVTTKIRTIAVFVGFSGKRFIPYLKFVYGTFPY
jgi:hypothetical protein